MRRSLVALVLVAGLLVACGGLQATSAPSGAPAGTGGTSTPVAGASMPVAGATTAPPAAPSPTQTVKQLAAAYLKAATTVNKASDKAWATWQKSPQTLTHAKRLARADAAAVLAFVRAVQKIPWYGDFKTLARRVLTPDNQAYVYYRSAVVSKTWLEWNDNMAEGDKASAKASGASNELRIALGLPPVPIK